MGLDHDMSSLIRCAFVKVPPHKRKNKLFSLLIIWINKKNVFCLFYFFEVVLFVIYLIRVIVIHICLLIMIQTYLYLYIYIYTYLKRAGCFWLSVSACALEIFVNIVYVLFSVSNVFPSSRIPVPLLLSQTFDPRGSEDCRKCG